MPDRRQKQINVCYYVLTVIEKLIMECPKCGSELYLAHRMTMPNGHFRNMDRIAEEVDYYVLECPQCDYIGGVCQIDE